LNAIPPGSLQGHARVEGTPPAGSAPWNPATVVVQLNPAGDWPQFGGSTFSINADGSFVIKDIGAGTYNVVAYDGREETYLKAVRLSGQDVLNRPIDLSQGASGELEIVFSFGTAEVHGTVQRSTGASMETTADSSGPLAVAVLALQSESGMIAGSARTDAGGNFALKSLAPGKYRIYAFEDQNGADLSNPDLVKALESKATEIEVKESENKQIELPLISSDELKQILTKLGLEIEQ
jgi:hypothetical protein